MDETSSSRSNSKWILSDLWILLIVAVMLRWIVSFYGYSGQGNSPMFGDYEAQRHWMEVTINLPVKEWYVNSSRNDLEYWGLDYPPLTAYHSLVCGYVAHFFNPAYVQYKTSRGYESSEHKLFMRSTVLISDLLTYLTAACLISKIVGSHFLALILLVYPGLILIDHGHFQYNCVSIGLALYAYTAFLKNRDIIGAIFFCLAINFKQMLLYYSLPIFFYLLGKCVRSGWSNGTFKFFSLGTAVILTFLFLWWPFFGFAEQVLKRIFPIERGLFEDKVSNIWCVINIFIKVRKYFKNSQLAIISALLTLSAILPSSLKVFVSPSPRNLTLSLINSSLGFFLFSYQVHEKTILLVALPVMLFYQEEPLHCLWFLIMTSFSMLPLLIKDDLFIPYISLNVIYLIALCCFTSSQIISKTNYSFQPTITLLIMSCISSVILNFLTVAVSPPQRYPHLYPLLVSVHCATHFFFFFLYFNWVQLVKTKKG